MSQVRRADAGHRADRRRRSHSPDTRTSGLLGAAGGTAESTRAAEAVACARTDLPSRPMAFMVSPNARLRAPAPGVPAHMKLLP